MRLALTRFFLVGAKATAGQARRAGKAASSRPKESAKRAARRAKDWSAVDALALRPFRSPQVPNVRKWSHGCYKRGRSTIDMVIVRRGGGPPFAIRWRDAETGEYTVAELETRDKRGTAHQRVVIVTERVYRDNLCADAAWDVLIHFYAIDSGVPLAGAAAVDIVYREVVDNKFGCLWRPFP
jgi:hypothetical protein